MHGSELAARGGRRAPGRRQPRRAVDRRRARRRDRADRRSGRSRRRPRCLRRRACSRASSGLVAEAPHGGHEGAPAGRVDEGLDAEQAVHGSEETNAARPRGGTTPRTPVLFPAPCVALREEGARRGGEAETAASRQLRRSGAPADSVAGGVMTCPACAPPVRATSSTRPDPRAASPSSPGIGGHRRAPCGLDQRTRHHDRVQVSDRLDEVGRRVVVAHARQVGTRAARRTACEALAGNRVARGAAEVREVTVGGDVAAVR